MTVDLHTKEDSSLPYDPFLLQETNKTKIHGSALNQIPRDFGSHTGDSLLNSTELTNQMQICQSHFTLQDTHKFDLPGIISSQNLETQCDSINWPASTLWSPLCSSQGSPEGSCSPKESSASASRLDSNLENTYNVVGMFEKMKLDKSGSYKHHSEYGIPSLELETSHVDISVCSYQSLINKQIRANKLSKLRQEQILSLKEKLAAYRENHCQISQQFQKKDQSACVGFGKGRRSHLQRQGVPYSYQKLAVLSNSCGSSDTYCNPSTSGTGVFLPRGTSSPQSESNRRPGKGCSTVLIPARVVQALQLHFNIAATSGPKPPAFPPLHDVLVSNSDGMYSLQKRQSRKKPAHIHNETILPQEWTY